MEITVKSKSQLPELLPRVVSLISITTLKNQDLFFIFQQIFTIL